MTDRPPIKPVLFNRFTLPQEHLMPNGCTCFYYHAPVSAIARISIMFPAGSVYEEKKLQAFFAYQLLKQGSKKKSAAVVNDLLDFYGSYTETELGKDGAILHIFLQNRYATELLSVISELITEPAFEESELEIFRNKQKQKFIISLEKVSGMARNALPELLFGSKHPYGGKVTPMHYDAITIEDLRQFYSTCIAGKKFSVMLAGLAEKDLLQAIDNTLGKIPVSEKLTEIPAEKFSVDAYKPTSLHIEKPDAIQNAILLAKPTPNRLHPDFYALHIATTALGGYFGSRLMRNIREDKGYTYGIGAAVSTYKNGGFFIVSTEVGADVYKDACKEIYKEIDTLCQELMDVEELETVKSYMQGDLLRDTDGPFALADRFLHQHVNHLPKDYMEQFSSAIQQVTPETIKEVAARYLHTSTLCEIVAGKK